MPGRAFIDLHCHTSASFDCLSRPRDVVRAAADRGLTHLVITDHDLGGVSVTGIELARIIRQRWPRVPVVLVSGSIVDSLRETARAAGIAACFMKPASMEELTAEVRRLCDTNEWVATRVQD